MIRSTHDTIFISESFGNEELGNFSKIYSELKSNKIALTIDMSSVRKVGTLALATLNRIMDDKNIKIVLSVEVSKELEEFRNISNYKTEKEQGSFIDKMVYTVTEFFGQLRYFIILSADVFYYSIWSLFNSTGRRKGSVYEQIFLMGNNAVPIVSLLSFLIGLILSLQSAAQLRQFGANIYLVDLIVIGMILEMGPMITAVIVAGRSGSAIAAEISTMQITEELDALKVMALNPLKYVVAPKMLAMTVSLPILTIIANMVGIFGGFIIGVLYLGLSPDIFINRTVEVMTLSFWRQSMLKSVLFSWLIVLIGAHFGFNVKGGSEGVGKAATASVVAAIFGVIMTDALLSLIFYFEF